ncbi:DUF2628 domain-containing protein [Rhodopila globiformis]|uniref:DUF2628 domain-containing protein n=1 Tax=Rhodopila globiformis TaxID=1071 RepID=UPI001304DAB3|nr:DUF2628 domain-containing protein [Rhodopila globiformis]
MRLYGAHFKGDAEPVLVTEGFSWGALILGPLWLAAHRAWVAAALSFAAYVFIAALAPEPAATVLTLGLALILGLIGNDLRSWALEHRGYVLVHILAGRNAEEAWMRLLEHRPDLVHHFRPGVA